MHWIEKQRIKTRTHILEYSGFFFSFKNQLYKNVLFPLKKVNVDKIVH